MLWDMSECASDQPTVVAPLPGSNVGTFVAGRARPTRRRQSRVAAVSTPHGASEIAGEYRSAAEICLSRKARPDALKKKRAKALFFVFEACVRIWLLPTVLDRLREVLDILFAFV